MSTLVVGEQPFMTAWLAQRRALGQDHRDEVWEGVYHVTPHASAAHARVAAQVLRHLAPLAEQRRLVDLGEFNLGGAEDFRVPDGGWLTSGAELGLYVPTAVAVLEVLSPSDETYAKLGFYADRGVQEVLVASPEERTVTCYRSAGAAARREGVSGPEGAGRPDGVGRPDGMTAPGRARWRPVADSGVFGCSMAWLAEQLQWP